MSQGLVTASYIVAAVLFIASLAGLSKQETAKYGNWFGITGMAIALIATIASPSVHGVIFILVAMVIGGAIGARLALKVEMTQMPELVAVLHSFVGLAAVLVGYNSFIELLPANAVQQLVLPLNGSPEEIMAAAQAAISQLAQQTASGHGHLTGAMLNIHLTEIFLGVFIGAVTCTLFGSFLTQLGVRSANLRDRQLLVLGTLADSIRRTARFFSRLASNLFRSSNTSIFFGFTRSGFCRQTLFLYFAFGFFCRTRGIILAIKHRLLHIGARLTHFHINGLSLASSRRSHLQR